MLVEIQSLRTALRTLERTHEDRSLPSMSLVVNTVIAVVDCINQFINATQGMANYGRALLSHAQHYLDRTVRVSVFGASLPVHSAAGPAVVGGTCWILGRAASCRYVGVV